jgi:ubiquinone/menaquinone biosynthesis C-methylase UbiE
MPFAREVVVAQMSSDKEALARLFTTTSAVHDTAGGLFAHFGQRLVDWSQLETGARVLDVAAGTGASLVPAAQRVGPGGKVVGVDIAPGMVARMEQVIDSNRLANAQAMVADGEQLPFENGYFDAVLCGFGLFFFPDPLRALTEFARVTRAGGSVALSTFTRDGSASMDAIWRRIGEYMPVPAPAPDETRFHEPAQLVGILERAGYVEVEVDVSPFQVLLPDVDAWLAWLRSMEFVDYLGRMSPVQLEQFRDSANTDLTGQGGKPGIQFAMDALLTRAHLRLL